MSQLFCCWSLGYGSYDLMWVIWQKRSLNCFCWNTHVSDWNENMFSGISGSFGLTPPWKLANMETPKSHAGFRVRSMIFRLSMGFVLGYLGGVHEDTIINSFAQHFNIHDFRETLHQFFTTKRFRYLKNKTFCTFSDCFFLNGGWHESYITITHRSSIYGKPGF